MTAYCIGTCVRYKARKPLEIGRYAAGQKRCNLCEVFINCNGVFCPCCKRKLRSLPRSRKGKEKYWVQRVGGEGLFAESKYDELLERYLEILEKEPQNIEALRYKACSFYFLKRYHEALSCYNKVITLEPANLLHYSIKSRILERLGRHEEAKSCYEKALKLNKSTFGHDRDEWVFQNEKPARDIVVL